MCAGEHTVIMLRPLQSAEVADSEWLAPFVSDFRTRFMTLLAGGRAGGRLGVWVGGWMV
jgi:tRNA(Met) C34 N-acetyltransferase TmcA